jgi:hypothetical protein
VSRRAAPPIRPFDGHHRVLEEIVESEVIDLFWRQPVQVDVLQPNLAAVLLHNRKCRTRDIVGIASKSFRKTARKRRFSSSEGAVQQNDVAAVQAVRESAAERCCLSL